MTQIICALNWNNNKLDDKKYCAATEKVSKKAKITRFLYGTPETRDCFTSGTAISKNVLLKKEIVTLLINCTLDMFFCTKIHEKYVYVHRGDEEYYHKLHKMAMKVFWIIYESSLNTCN